MRRCWFEVNTYRKFTVPCSKTSRTMMSTVADTNSCGHEFGFGQTHKMHVRPTVVKKGAQNHKTLETIELTFKEKYKNLLKLLYSSIYRSKMFRSWRSLNRINMTLVYDIDSIAYKIQDTDVKQVTEVNQLARLKLSHSIRAQQRKAILVRIDHRLKLSSICCISYSLATV